MKRKTIIRTNIVLLILAALMLLSGCGKRTDAKSLLSGRWYNDGQAEYHMDLLSDGTLVSSNGEVVGKWGMNGGTQIYFTSLDGEREEFSITAFDLNQMTIENELEKYTLTRTIEESSPEVKTERDTSAEAVDTEETDAGNEPPVIEEEVSGTEPPETEEEVSGIEPFETEEEVPNIEPVETEEEVSDIEPVETKEEVSGIEPAEIDKAAGNSGQIKSEEAAALLMNAVNQYRTILQAGENADSGDGNAVNVPYYDLEEFRKGINEIDGTAISVRYYYSILDLNHDGNTLELLIGKEIGPAQSGYINLVDVYQTDGTSVVKLIDDAYEVEQDSIYVGGASLWIDNDDIIHFYASSGLEDYHLCFAAGDMEAVQVSTNAGVFEDYKPVPWIFFAEN